MDKERKAEKRPPGRTAVPATALVVFIVIVAGAVLLAMWRKNVAVDSEGVAPTSQSQESTSSVVGEPGVAAPDSGEADDPAAEPLPRLLDLGADTCIPCKTMAPILKEMRGTFAGQLRVDFIDVWKNSDAAKEYRVTIIPTQIFFDPDGNELFRHQGFYSREDMLGKWRELGYEFDELAE